MGKRNDEEWMAQDGHFGAVALGVPAVSGAGCRDAVNPAVQQAGAAPPAFRVVPAGQRFTIRDQWAYILPSNPGVQSAVGGVIIVRASDGALFPVGEPFYASGTQEFALPANAPSDLLVWLAPRREMLSWTPQLGKASNDAAFSELYNSTFVTPSIGAGQWAYLDAGLNWQVAASGQTPLGMPFGWGAPNPDIRGRYYDVELYNGFVGGGGVVCQTLFLYSFSPTGAADLATEARIVQSTQNQSVLIGVGDEPSGIYSCVSASLTNPRQLATFKSARLWTVGFLVASPATVSGFMSVIRRGF